jgi:putative redox protein
VAVECVSEGDSFAVRVSVAGHELTVDEPERLGGTDTGPSPFAILAASVGTCTAITVVDAARDRGLSVDRVHVTVRLKQNKVSSSAGDPRLFITEIRRSIEIDGDLTAEDRGWLYRRGESCPVSRSISAGIATPATPVPAAERA